ncbi:MAG TPA: hypothetical protein VGG08_08750 [Solirubrobacteraceae bacterium]
MAAARHTPAVFEPATIGTFRFLSRELRADGSVSLRYALDDFDFEEMLLLPVAALLDEGQRERVEPLLALLHWVAGVSYYKAALPARIELPGGAPPAAAELLEALYSEGLGELAYTNGVPVPRPCFPGSDLPASPLAQPPEPRKVLVPVGGGKDSAVAIEVVRAAGVESLALFSVGQAPPILRTVAAAGLDHLLATRRIDPALLALNEAGAINGHVPITAVVSCIALLVAALNGFHAVAMANERSASSPNLSWDGIEVNHQFSKSLSAERLLSAAVRESGVDVAYFSVLRPASELAIARAFTRLERYHGAFTSCNAIFRIDPDRRASSWCCECPKCRFVYLALAPFSSPEHLREIFGRDLLDEPSQYEGFALLGAIGGHKPFECVGEERESQAAIRLLADDPRWREHAVVRRLAAEIPSVADDEDDVLALSDDHDVPPGLMAGVDALLRA